MTDPFFEASVAGDDPRAVINQVRAIIAAQDPFGDRHADAVGDALTEGSGGHFDGGGDTSFGVTRRARMRLAKGSQIIGRHVVAELVGEGVLQNTGVPVTHDEAVAVAPPGIRRIVTHHASPQRDAEWCQGHGGSAVARVGGRRSVHGHRGDLANGPAF